MNRICDLPISQYAFHEDNGSDRNLLKTKTQIWVICKSKKCKNNHVAQWNTKGKIAGDLTMRFLFRMLKMCKISDYKTRQNKTRQDSVIDALL